MVAGFSSHPFALSTHDGASRWDTNGTHAPSVPVAAKIPGTAVMSALATTASASAPAIKCP